MYTRAVDWLKRHRFVVGLVLCLAVAAFFSTYRLTESPKTWFDEGIFLQVARNVLTSHSYVLRESPSTLVPATLYTTVGYPVIGPVAASFAVFGIGILQARAVMVMYILLFIIASYVFAFRVWGVRVALLSTLILATYAPLYGNGKNVLGEIPGAFFLFLILICLARLERKSQTVWNWIGLGLATGVFVSTKPNFFLLLPVLGAVLLWNYRRLTWSWKSVLAGLLAFLVPVVLYVVTQFGASMSPATIFASYAGMPGLQQVTGLTFGQMVIRNIVLFVTAGTPAYLLVSLGVWVSSLVIRVRRKTIIPLHEIVALGFAFVTVAYFLKMPGFFRYLLVGQLIAFPYLVAACTQLTPPRFKKSLVPFLFVCLVAFQAYQVGFSSFVAGYYPSTRSQELTAYFDALPSSTQVFLFHAPEVATFIHGENYSQYFEVVYFLDAFGKDQLPRLAAGEPDLVIVSVDEKQKADPYLDRYSLQTTLDEGRYLIYGRNI